MAENTRQTEHKLRRWTPAQKAHIVRHPQSNGKLERFHKTLKGECVRQTAMADLQEARRLIAQYVRQYNAKRLHSALHYLTPCGYLQGQEHIQARLADVWPPYQQPHSAVACTGRSRTVGVTVQRVSR